MLCQILGASPVRASRIPVAVLLRILREGRLEEGLSLRSGQESGSCVLDSSRTDLLDAQLSLAASSPRHEATTDREDLALGQELEEVHAEEALDPLPLGRQHEHGRPLTIRICKVEPGRAPVERRLGGSTLSDQGHGPDRCNRIGVERCAAAHVDRSAAQRFPRSIDDAFGCCIDDRFAGFTHIF
ncbi:hypothetical protein [Plantibacter sp. M259]|uniref:hypothetical protein n=1 Tax=Plantibacter sp. M259 TaxID=2583822 RepID=UPI00143DD6BE|nr:hypothetical protein [Plantibacter sp. M259]